MKPRYNDILDATGTLSPLWYDQNGAPRFLPFHTDLISDIYAHEAVLMKIGCQYCGKPFKVELVIGVDNELLKKHFQPVSFSKQIKEKRIHYGDPPHHECIGDSMNSIPISVIQYWKSDDSPSFKWKRDHSFEVSVIPKWAASIDVFNKCKD